MLSHLHRIESFQLRNTSSLATLTNQPSAQPTSSTYALNEQRHRPNDPLTVIILVSFAFCTLSIAFCVFFNRFCLKRQILQLVERNAIGRFMIELSPEVRHNQDEMPLRDRQALRPSRCNSGDDLDNVHHVPSPVISRYYSFISFFHELFSFTFFTNGSSTVVETTAIVRHNFQQVVACDYDAADDEDEESFSARPGVMRVLDGDVFNMIAHHTIVG